jgi:transposase
MISWSQHVLFLTIKDRTNQLLRDRGHQRRLVCAGAEAARQGREHGIRIEVVKLSEAKKGFVLLPRRWVVERSFGWAAHFKRLSRDYERLASTLTGMHWLAFATLLLSSLFGKS